MSNTPTNQLSAIALLRKLTDDEPTLAISQNIVYANPLPKNPIVITYDNQPTDNTRFFLKTLEANGWDYKVVGEGEEWKGFTTKMLRCKKTLAELHPDAVVIVSDARDVMCLRGPTAFMEAFCTLRKDIVLSMELLCGINIDVSDNFKHFQCKPITNYWKFHNISKLPLRKFVNAGLIAGKAGKLLKFYEWALDNKFEDDQLALGHYVNKYPEDFAVDGNAEMLHTSVFGVNAGLLHIHLQKQDSPTLAELYGRGAFFLHIPGYNHVMGQRILYKDVRKIMDLDINHKHLSSYYKYNEPDWTPKDIPKKF